MQCTGWQLYLFAPLLAKDNSAPPRVGRNCESVNRPRPLSAPYSCRARSHPDWPRQQRIVSRRPYSLTAFWYSHPAARLQCAVKLLYLLALLRAEQPREHRPRGGRTRVSEPVVAIAITKSAVVQLPQPFADGVVLGVDVLNRLSANLLSLSRSL